MWWQSGLAQDAQCNNSQEGGSEQQAPSNLPERAQLHHAVHMLDLGGHDLAKRLSAARSYTSVCVCSRMSCKLIFLNTTMFGFCLTQSLEAAQILPCHA